MTQTRSRLKSFGIVSGAVDVKRFDDESFTNYVFSVIHAKVLE